MKKSLLGALFAVVLSGASAAPALAVQAPDAPAKKPAPRAVNFAGTVALSNCSGSVVRMPDSQPGDPALVMSNGHCLEGGMPGPGDVVVDQPSSRTFTLLDAKAQDVATLKASKVVYGTMTDTDVSLYELTTTYQEIEQQHGIKALELQDQHPEQGRAITVVSGYWKKTYSCSVGGFAHELREGDWTFKDSLRYTSECDIIGGTSGSPVLDDETGKVVAVNNTINEGAEDCSVNNPCEVDENGEVTVHKNIGYAQETYGIPACIGEGSKLDLDAEGCTLPKPSGR
ncbi:trypsin-like peptidase domain-containing protein [Streptomyces sp. NA04227]|uniref:trypsin-like peptidase domain-containing protein n=1 Tax=Streptomyces sp. NA04227 TaxID=2742136 RepID=UPI0015923214|nr:serine protease [Streptomyces sp. NA04227]QKW09191.1 trypsin-like peptidase domain-containing protein [Streptomyces sp. NA04227]